MITIWDVAWRRMMVAMPYPGYITEEIARRGREVYEREVRHEAEPAHRGRFLVLDVGSGDYEISDDLDASERLLERRPDALLYGLRIGERAAYRIGGRFRPAGMHSQSSRQQEPRSGDLITVCR
jgi:hypothetical protein